ncbi:hypothetical protein ABPG75_013652 [Micractinium tetrahymenae]
MTEVVWSPLEPAAIWQTAPLAPQPLSAPADPGSDSDSTAAILARGTIVVIRGNARTKASLIGQRAVVRRAVGLGGWHWLQVLPSGEEVKLQRNALEVLERPSGLEPDFSEEEEEEARRQQQAAAAAAAARGYPYEPAEPHAEDRPRPPRRPSSVPPGGRPGASAGGSLFDADYAALGRTRLPSSRGAAAGQPRINLGKLQTAALKRYGAVHHLPEESAASREALLDAVSEHFAAQQVDENEVIACFLSAVKRHRMGLTR